jgi:hypothetical protein
VVTKKQRRRQLARASAQRKQLRRTARAARRRRIRTVTTAVVLVAALVALVAWIATHGDAGNTAGAVVDYDAVSANDSPTAIAEVTR